VNNLKPVRGRKQGVHRKFHRGSTVVELDNTNRLLLPQQLLDFAGIDKDIVLYTYANRIEIWAQKEFDKLFKDDKTNYSKLSERVMGRKKRRMMYHELFFSAKVLMNSTWLTEDLRGCNIWGGGHSGEIIKRLGTKGS
jgi:hypothetical protein